MPITPLMQPHESEEPTATQQTAWGFYVAPVAEVNASLERTSLQLFVNYNLSAPTALLLTGALSGRHCGVWLWSGSEYFTSLIGPVPEVTGEFVDEDEVVWQPSSFSGEQAEAIETAIRSRTPLPEQRVGLH